MSSKRRDFPKNKNIFVTADTHFKHDNIIKFVDSAGKLIRNFKSIEQHDEYLVKKWNQTVGKDDIVIHLGDVQFSSDDLSILSRLNGIKYLVMGNHDMLHISEYLKYFEDVKSSIKLGDMILTHIPIHPQELRYKSKNVHGHIHKDHIPDPRYMCVCVDVTDYKPVLIRKKLGGI